MNPTLAFFARLHRGGQYAYYHCLPERRSYWYATARPLAPPEEATTNWYISVHPSSAIPPCNAHGEVREPMYVRAQKRYICAINCLYGEFDAKTYGSKDAIAAHIASAPWPAPSVLIDSGAGIHCMPLNTEILTQDGWKTWDQVEPGARVLGYDRERDVMAWTTMRGKVVKETDALVRVFNGTFSAICTPDHQWVCHVKKGHQSARLYRNQLVPASDISRWRHKLVLSAPVTDETPDPLPISSDEAAILGWFVTEGSMNKQVKISQSERKYANEIRALLRDIPHTEGRYHGDTDVNTWRIDRKWFRELYTRAGLIGSKRDADWSAFVLRLSHDARRAFLDAAFKGDGTQNRNQKVIIQNPGQIAEAIKLAILCEGHTPRTSYPPGRNVCNIRYGTPSASWDMQIEPAGEGAVWCPQTDLGTWVMRQGNTICITGNCYWLLREPWLLQSDDARQAAELVQRAWVQQVIGADPSVHDLVRILRVPGTRNFKYDSAPDVRFLTCDLDRQYALQALAAHLPPIHEAEPRFVNDPPRKSNSIDRFNRDNAIGSLLERYGYRWVGTRRMVSPDSGSARPGVTIDCDTNRAYVHTGGDVLSDGYWKKPFDVIRLLDCGGDFQKALEAIRR